MLCALGKRCEESSGCIVDVLKVCDGIREERCDDTLSCSEDCLDDGFDECEEFVEFICLSLSSHDCMGLKVRNCKDAVGECFS